MKIIQAVQIWRDIEELYQNKGNNNITVWNRDNWYGINMPSFGTIIDAHRCPRHKKMKKTVAPTFWTKLIGTAGDSTTVPTTFTVTFNNSGVLPHAPNEKDAEIEGLPALLIYNKLKRLRQRDQQK